MATITNSRPAVYSRGTLSTLARCNIETIRYYEQIGLLADPPRSAGGHRQYGDADLRRLTFIRRARELGFSLKDVRGLLDLVDGDGGSCAEVKALTLEHAGEIHRKIGDLRKIERVLQAMAAQCDHGRVPACPVIDALFQGTGGS